VALTVGTRLGPYEVAAQIGVGGMGEVYKARDTRLDRTVAIKVLTETLASDPQFRERFDREARAISQLTHPHICTLHDVGEHTGTAYLVMEYLEGETLEHRLQKGALPLDQALTIAIQLTSALDQAHRAGITHRDLKPGNIMLTKSGAKLLDFGLAKTGAAAVAGAGLSMLPTTPAHLTAQGTILGTFQYMAPEQLEGHEADARTDLFAFGAALYEMLTGKKAFEGKSHVSLIGAIVKDEPPPISSIQPLTPAALDRVVKKCLAKDPDRRWQSASDLHDELVWIAEAASLASSVSATSTVGVTRATRGRLARVVWSAVSIGLALLTGAAAWYVRPPAQGSLARVTLTLPAGERLVTSEHPAIALSPTGSHLAYVASRGGPSQIYVRAIGQSQGQPLAGTEGGRNPFFSPDGQWVGFFADRKLKKVSIKGGTPITLCDAANPRGATWTSDDAIVFAPLSNSGLWKVPARGGTPQALTIVDQQKRENSHRWPFVLPGGKAVLFSIEMSSAKSYDIAVQSLETGQRRILVEGGASPRYLPTGHLLYARASSPTASASSLVAVPFDVKRLQVTGDPIPVVDNVQQWLGGAHVTMSTDWLVYVPARNQDVKLVWVDRSGTAMPLPAPPGSYDSPRVSPDGREVAVSGWTYSLERNTLTRLSLIGGSRPVWSPDGSRIVFSSTKSGTMNLFWKRFSIAGSEEQLTTADRQHYADSWSPDGRFLVFTEMSPQTGRDIWALPLAGDRKPTPILQTPFDETNAAFSPNSRWLAYTSNESGRFEIYVQAFPDGGARQQVSTDGGSEPLWAKSGRELFYRNGDAVMAVPVAAEHEFKAGSPSVLFQGAYERTESQTNYDVAPDGRFLMLRNEEPAPTQVNVILNWPALLKK